MTIEQIPETWRKTTKDSDGVVRIWSNRVVHAVAHVLEYPEQNAVADLIVAAPETARQRDELLEALKTIATFPDDEYDRELVAAFRHRAVAVARKALSGRGEPTIGPSHNPHFQELDDETLP